MVGSEKTEQGTAPSRFAWLRPAVLPAWSFLITVAAFLPPAMRGIDCHHDGIVFKTAMDVMAGQTIHKDTFTQYGALTTYLQVASLWAMGTSLLSLKVGTVFCYAAAAAFLTASWQMFLPPMLVFVSSLVWLGMPSFYSTSEALIFLSWSSVYALLFQSMALYFLLRSLKSPSLANPLLCGATSALVAWCRMPVGGVHAVSVVAVLLIMAYATPRRGRFLGALAAYLVGTAMVHAAFFVHLWWVGALRDWYYQIIAWPAFFVGTEYGSSTPLAKVVKVVPKLFMLDPLIASISEWYAPGIPRKSQGPISLILILLASMAMIGLAALPHLLRPASPDVGGRGRPRFLATMVSMALVAVLAPGVLRDYHSSPDIPFHFAIPVVILTATLATLARGFWRPGGWKEPEDPTALAVACGLVCLASWLQYYPLNDTRHRFWAIAPGIGLFAFFLLRSAGGRTTAVAAAVVLFALPMWAARVVQVVDAARQPFSRLGGDSPVAGMYVRSADAPRWNALLDAVDRQLAVRGDVPMLSMGPDALFGTLVRDLRNPFPFFIVWNEINTEGRKAYDWGRFGVPDIEAKRQAFVDRYSPLIYMNSADLRRLDDYLSQGYEVILDEAGHSSYGVDGAMFLARESPGAGADRRARSATATPAASARPHTAL